MDLGKRIGQDLLTIIDDGTILGNGYVPYDDEGTKGKKHISLQVASSVDACTV